MSILDKQQFIKEIEGGLYDKLTSANIDIVRKVILDTLNSYEVQSTGKFWDANLNAQYIKMFTDAKAIEGLSSKTLRRYNIVINYLFNAEHVAVTAVTVFHVRDFFMQEKNRGISDITIEGYRSVLSSFFGWLFNEGMIEKNPCANVSAIKCKKEVKLPFSKEELQLIQENCRNNRDRAIVAFLQSTGCRIGEVCALNVEDVNLQDMECTVLGKGNKERTVYLDEVARLLIKRYLKRRKGSNNALFLNKAGERISADGIRYMLNGVSKRSKVPNVHPHRFRRTLATNLIARGMPIQDVAKILGHERVDTTMTYVYLDKGQIKNAYKKYTA